MKIMHTLTDTTKGKHQQYTLHIVNRIAYVEDYIDENGNIQILDPEFIKNEILDPLENFCRKYCNE